MEKINATFGTPKDRWFHVEWTKHPGKDSWEPERSLIRQGCEPVIKKFWNSTHLNPATDFIPDPDDVWRCWTCGRGYKTDSALSRHITFGASFKTTWATHCGANSPSTTRQDP